MSWDDSWRQFVERRLQRRRKAGLLRELEALEPHSPVHVERDGSRDLVLFSSNDYLGLSGDPRVIAGVQETIERYGLGPRGSPLICGYSTLHQRLERRIARWKGAESALLCPTGFAANLAVISALADAETTIFSDALNHASIIDGCSLAKRGGATLEVVPHRDTETLRRKLEACRSERTMVVTDSVFSMDGDLAPLEELADICDHFGALFVVDEAHGGFVFGQAGRGLAQEVGVVDDIDIHVGTLSKGAGGMGGFIATRSSLRTLLLNLGRSYIYSTAAPLSVIGGLLAAVEVVETDQKLRRRLWERVEQLEAALGTDLDSPIVPIVIGGEDEALAASRQLRDRGIDVTAIRPPTVPEGTSRLRITLSAAHTEDDVQRLIDGLRAIGAIDSS